jgi:hypothetical protein
MKRTIYLMIDIVMVGVIVGMLLFMLISIGRGAPAPMPKPAVIRTVERLAWANLVGDWDMLWCGGEWQIALNADGTYLCISDDCNWVGNWWIDFEGRLSVIERMMDENGVPGSSISWAVKWDTVGGKINPEKLTGALCMVNSCYGKFGLTKVRRKR